MMTNLHMYLIFRDDTPAVLIIFKFSSHRPDCYSSYLY